MLKRHAAAVLLALSLCLAAPVRQALAEELVVSAAASLTNALGEIARAFEARHPAVRVTANFGASGALLRQMENGAPVDVFASADERTMDEAASKGLVIPATRRDFARNTLVLAVPADSRLVIRDARDLSQAGVRRIALGNPDSVPAGRYAREWLTGAGQWDALARKYIYGNSVRQVLDYVSRGEVDAALVFATDARQAGAKVRVAMAAATRTPALYPAAVCAGSKKPGARAFVDFLLGAEGQRILAAHGFGRP